MMRLAFALVLCLFVGLLVLPAGAATFEEIDSSFTISQFQSHYPVYESGPLTSMALKGLYIRNIEYYNNNPPSIILIQTDYPGSFLITNTTIPSGHSTFDMVIRGTSDIIASGDIYYNLLYDSEGDPSRITVWVEFDNWDSGGYSGVKETTFNNLDVTSTGLNGLCGIRSNGFRITSLGTEDWEIAFRGEELGGVTKLINGDYILNEQYLFDNDYTITPNNGENPTSFAISLDRNEYYSGVHIYTASFNYILDFGLNSIDTTVYEYPIHLNIQAGNGQWSNQTFYDFGTSSDYWTLTLSNDEPQKYEIITATLEEEAGAPALTHVSYYQQPSSYELPIYGNYDEDHIMVQYQNSGGSWYKFNTSSLAYDIPVSEAAVYTWETKFYSTGEFNAVCYLTTATPPPITLKVPVTVTEEEVQEGIITFRPYDASTGSALWCQYEIYDHTADDVYSGGGTVHSLIVPIGHMLTYNAYKVNYNNGTWTGIFTEDGETHTVYLHKLSGAVGEQGELELVAVNNQDLVIGGVTFTVQNSTWAQTKVGNYVTFTLQQDTEYTYTAKKTGWSTGTGSVNLTSDYELVKVQLTGSAGLTVTATSAAPVDDFGAMEAVFAPFISNAPAMGYLIFLVVLVGFLNMLMPSGRRK